MDETRAIQLCLKHRDPIGFEFLVEKYRREAFFHAYHLLGNRADALDACQDAFARAYVGLGRLEELTQFYPWFYRILRNRCLNLLDRRRTSERYVRSEAEVESSQRWNSPPEPAHRLDQQERQSELQAALASLQPEHREIITLKYLQDRSYAEIAGLLAIPRGTVMSRLYHARLALREACLRIGAHPTSNYQESP